MQPISASFRDRSGYVFCDGEKIIRTINNSFKKHWEYAITSGLLHELVNKKMVIEFKEQVPLAGSWKSLEVERVPFISYPYEWSFSQLKDAALLTLELQKQAIDHGMSLKDASAYNVQFLGNSAKFIDLLSFEKWEKGTPWKAYQQFCTHFLAPLALTCHTDIQCGPMTRLWIDGIPLSLVCALLPKRTLFFPRLFWHLYLHAKMQQKHSNIQTSAKKTKKVRVSTETLKGIANSLTNTIKNLTIKQNNTEWANYYDDTNYSNTATALKIEFVQQVASDLCREGKLPMAIDLGANTGVFSKYIAPYFEYVLAPDIDPCAVDKHYLKIKNNGASNILPLVIDLANVSPALGWACSERDSFDSRCNVNFINALALIHHLVISAGIPLHLISNYISTLLKEDGILLIEFVPKEDSQVKRMLATREDVFVEYNIEEFKRYFSMNFQIEKIYSIPETVRTLFVMRKLSK